MAHDPTALQSARVHLTINGDELIWTVHPKGLQALALFLIAAGVASAAGGGLLALNVLQEPGLDPFVRLIGSTSVATAGACLMATFLMLAVRDGWSEATVRLDRRQLTVQEVVLNRSRTRRWSRDELKAITVGHHQSRHDMLTAIKNVGLFPETALRVESTGGEPQPVLGGLSLNGELTWLAAILREHLDTPPDAAVHESGRDVLVEIDQHVAESGGQVTVPLPGPHGEGWGMVKVPVPPGARDGQRLPVRGLGPRGGDLHVRLRFGESDERAESFELARELAHSWEY